MRLLAAVFALAALAPAAPAAEPDIRTAIADGLKFLAADSVEWKTERKCASCHHAPMALWALHEAKKHGYTVDDKAVAELTTWLLAKDDPAKINPKQPKPTTPPAVLVNQTPLMLAFGLAAGNLKDAVVRDGLKAMLALVLEGQATDGSWRLMYVWEPLGSTPDVMTTLALLALTGQAAADRGAESKAALEKGLKWLEAATPSDTPQAAALRLLLWKRLGRPAADWEPLAKKLLAWQHTDGGWGQGKDMESDAFSTGQALYALAEASHQPNDPALRKACDYLVKSQAEDGSWEMASRPGGPGGKSAKNLAPITTAGTAWAVLGLVHQASAIAKPEAVPPRPEK